MRWLWAGVGLALVVWLRAGVAEQDRYVQERQAVTQLRALRIALEAYREERGGYPGLEDPASPGSPGLSSATLYHALLEDGGDQGPFLYWDPNDTGPDASGRPVLLDPWGQPFAYHRGLQLVRSGGPDQRVGSRDDLSLGMDLGGDSARQGLYVHGLPPSRSSVRLQALAPPALFLLGWMVWGLMLALSVLRRAAPIRAAPVAVRVVARLGGDDHPLRCAWCHDYDMPAQLHGCARCGVTLHADCWALSPRCPTLGCAPTVRRLRAPVVVTLQPARG